MAEDRTITIDVIQFMCFPETTVGTCCRSMVSEIEKFGLDQTIRLST